IRSLAGLEKWHSSMLQVATESLHPHWQPMRAPTRRTSTLGFSEAVCAMAATVMTAVKSQLLLNRGMFLGDPHHFGTCVLHFDFARHQADESAANQYQAADPNPGHQREHISLNHGALIVVRHAAEIQIEVLIGTLPDADFGSALPAGLVEPLLGLKGAQHV